MKNMMSKANCFTKHKNAMATKCCPTLLVFAIVGMLAVVASVAYAVYRFMFPEYVDFFEDSDDDESDTKGKADDKSCGCDMQSKATACDCNSASEDNE